MADTDSTGDAPVAAEPSKRGPGRPRKAGNEHLPPGVYLRVRNGKPRYFDQRGKPVRSDEIVAFAIKRNRYTDSLAVSVDEIIKRSLPADHLSGVYFLIKDEQVVYVGQSVNMYRRVEAHRLQGKAFDRVTYMPARAEVLRELEMVYIHMLRPVGNLLKPTDRRHRIYEARAGKRLAKVMAATEPAAPPPVELKR